ncbi:MAG TPA: hypothetical protein VFC67_04235 [Prolixibacteraceae bacterium]|nr:hypothetical protein [Prolixibacteraceae bacterium]
MRFFATRAPGHQSQNFGTPNLIINILTFVEFGVFVIWWHSYIFERDMNTNALTLSGVLRAVALNDFPSLCGPPSNEF